MAYVQSTGLQIRFLPIRYDKPPVSVKFYQHF